VKFRSPPETYRSELPPRAKLQNSRLPRSTVTGWPDGVETGHLGLVGRLRPGVSSERRNQRLWCAGSGAQREQGCCNSACVNKVRNPPVAKTASAKGANSVA
jgi:hypothetical protein